VKETGTGKPVAGAKVALAGSDYSDTTNDEGYFHLSQVPAGQQGFEISSEGYEGGRVSIPINQGQTAQLAIELKPQ
jgi:uncharacterized membrane protein